MSCLGQAKRGCEGGTLNRRRVGFTAGGRRKNILAYLFSFMGKARKPLRLPAKQLGISLEKNIILSATLGKPLKSQN